MKIEWYFQNVILIKTPSSIPSPALPKSPLILPIALRWRPELLTCLKFHMIIPLQASLSSQTIISLDFCPQLQQSQILRQQLRYDLCQCCLNISASSEPNFHCLVNLHSSFVTYLQSQIQGSPF